MVSGVAYFLVYTPSFLHEFYAQFFDGADAIVSFDLDTEDWSWEPEPMQGPESNMFYHDGQLRLRLAALNGRLAVAHFRRIGDNCEALDIWLRDGSSPRGWPGALVPALHDSVHVHLADGVGHKSHKH